MEFYEKVFDGTSIYQTLFFNVKGVLENPSLEELKKRNPDLYNNWKFISNGKYNDKSGNTDPQTIYENNAIFYPEYSKIVSIAYANIYMKNGELKRFFRKIVDGDEYIVIATFMDVLNELSNNTENFPMLCGHNIINYDLPFLIKRYVHFRERFGNDKGLPLMLKKYLNSKPWDLDVIDTINVWGFNGFKKTSLNLISDFLGLKKTTRLLSYSELSKYYWDNIKINAEDTLKYIAFQSANQTNLTIQLMNEMRQF